MSGTNRLVLSVMQGGKKSESAVTSALSDSNTVAKSQDVKNGKKKEAPKKK